MERGGNTSLLRTPLPDWCDDAPFDASARTIERSASRGRAYLLMDDQINAMPGAHASYSRRALAVVNASGLEYVGSFSIDHNPAYQTLHLHRLIVHRDGKAIDQFETAKIDQYRRERELERQIVDGWLTTSIHLRDLRVGDVVEYAYTVSGINPVFDDRVFRWFVMAYYTPMADVRRRLISPRGAKLFIKTFGKAPAAKVESRKTHEDRRWRSENLPAVQDENNIPSWFQILPAMQVTAYPDWASVAALFRPLYPDDPPLPDGFREELAVIEAEARDPEDRAAMALRFVQTYARYLAIGIGEGGFRPRDLEEIWRSRLGDCKDKSLLLATMLRHLGIKACPALVNTYDGASLSELLPAPGPFNHCIVKAVIGGRVFWLDPTRSEQKGVLTAVFQPDFRFALALEPNTQGLEPMNSARSDIVNMECEQQIDLTKGAGQPVSLTVKTVFRSYSAERVRYRLAMEGRQEFDESVLKYLERQWGNIERKSPIEVADDERANVITTIESYRLGSPWKHGEDEKGVPTQFSYGPSEAFSAIFVPPSGRRQFPYEVAYPSNSRERIEVLLPVALKFPEKVTTLDGPAVKGKVRMFSEGDRRLVSQIEIASLRDHVLPNEYEEFQKGMARLSDAAYRTYFASTNAPPRRQSKVTRWIWIILAIGWLTVFVYTNIKQIDRFERFHQSPSPPAMEDQQEKHQTPPKQRAGDWTEPDARA